MAKTRMSAEKRRLLVKVTDGRRHGQLFFTKPMLVTYPGTSGAGGITRTLKALVNDGYLNEDEGRFTATDKGMAYQPGRGRGGGPKPVITPEKIARARLLLSTPGATQKEVASQIGISANALRLALNPDRNEARSKRRRENYRKDKARCQKS